MQTLKEILIGIGIGLGTILGVYLIIWILETFFPSFLTVDNFQSVALIGLLIGLVHLNNRIFYRKDFRSRPGFPEKSLFDEIDAEEVTVKRFVIKNKHGRTFLTCGIDVLDTEETDPRLELVRNGDSLYVDLPELAKVLGGLIYPYNEESE